MVTQILHLIISYLTGIIFCFHLTEALKNPRKLSLKILSLYLTLKKILKKISKNELKFKDKPWITPGLQKIVSIKNQFLSNFIKLKDPCKKGRPHNIQTIQKSFINVIKKVNNFFTRFFQKNIKELKICG